MKLPDTSLKMTVGQGILSHISFQIDSVFSKCSLFLMKAVIFSKEVLYTSYEGKWGQKKTLTLSDTYLCTVSQEAHQFVVCTI
jgi:hypothetical protein